MSDYLVDRLLQSSSPSQLKTILNGYLDTPECKRDGEFYCSLKSVLVSLQKHGEISDEIILQIYQQFCLPILHKNFPERVVLYSVYELIVLCCELGPETLSEEVLTVCFEGLLSFTKDSTSPSGLPVVVCLDLVSSLMNDKSSIVVDEKSSERLFDSLLDVLCKADELLCARMSGGVLPLFLGDKNEVTQIRLKKLWSRVKDLTETESFSTSNKHDKLQMYFSTMCSLFDVFITISNPQASTILHDAKFWELLQQGLQQQDTLSSKRSLYLLKRALDHIEKGNLSFEVKSDNGDVIFSWEPKKKKYWLDIWQEFVLLIETLSETQVHVIKPVLTRLSKIVSATELNTADSQALHISWLTTIIHKASLHPNRFIRKWAVLEVLTLDLAKTPLLQPQNWAFMLGHFQLMLGEYGLYGKDHDGIPGTYSAVGTALSTFYKNWFCFLSKDLHVEFMSKLITTIEEQRFAAVPLACIFLALSNIPEMALLGLDSLHRIKTILIHQRTHALTLRLATKGFILTTVANLANPSLVTWDAVFNLLAVGRLEECLQRNSWLWNRLCSWIWKTELSRQQSATTLSETNQRETLNQFLMMKLDHFLKDQEVHQDLVNDEAVSLGRLIIAVSDTIHSHSKESSDIIPTLLSKIFENFYDASTRLYMSEAKLSKAVTLVTSILQVLCDFTGSHDNIEETTPDHTKELVTKSLLQSLSDILNLLQRKLTFSAKEGDSSQNFSFLELFQKLYNFYTGSPSMKSSWPQFCILLETITKANIKTIQDLQGYSNHDSQQWSTMHQSMMLLTQVCDIITGSHVTIPEAIPTMLLDAIPTFKLNIDLRRPSNVLTSDKSFQDTKESTNSWRMAVSGYLGNLWKAVAYFLEHSSTSATSPDNQDDKAARDGQVKLTVNSSSKQVLESAIEALDVASCKNAIPILSSIGLLIPKLLTQDVAVCSHALDMVWASLKTMWDDPEFWEIYQATMAVLLNPSLLMLPGDHPLTLKIKARIDEAVTEGEHRPGIMNVVVEQLSKVWTSSRTCSSSLLVYKDLVVDLLLHNASIQKSHVTDYHVDAFLRHVLSDQSPLCAVSRLERRDDAEVRLVMTNILLTLDSTDPTRREVLFEIVKALLAKDKEITTANIKMYVNSRSHRRKHRAWQAVLVLLPLAIEGDTNGARAEEVLHYTFKSLEDSNQLSVQNFQQWAIIYILNRFPDLAPLLWDELKHDPDKRLGRIGLLATVAMVFTIYCMTDPKKRGSFFKRAISSIFPWISTNHRQARVYSQVAVQRLWYYCVKENLELVLAEKDFIEPCLDMMTTINDTLADKVRLLENYFFFDFDPIRDISMETIYLTLPKHSGISEEEWVQPEQFEKSALGMRVTKALESHGIPLYNKDRHLAEFVPEPYNYKESAGVHFHRRIRGEKAPTAKPINNSEFNGISDGRNVQKKIIAWKIVPPDEMMMAELQQQRMLSLKKSSGGNLIVVASLIDKAPNLGGLCRTSEIFGVKKLVLGSNEIMKDKNFQNLSVSSSKWVDVEQVRPMDLKDYLQTMKRQGYTLIGVEQTANSKPLTQYTFPHDALLLLGNEKEGIPADLIQFLDVCVEIPQIGIIRSLNVHVSGALLIWEYTRQRVLCDGNAAD